MLNGSKASAAHNVRQPLVAFTKHGAAVIKNYIWEPFVTIFAHFTGKHTFSQTAPKICASLIAIWHVQS